MRRFLILLQFIILAAANQAIAQTVETEYAMLLTSTDRSQLSDDEQAAYDWFQANYTTQAAATGKPKGTFLAPGDLSRLSAGYTKVLWVHIDKDDFANSYPNMSAYFSAGQLQQLANYVKAGGNMLLTTHAAALVESIGRVPTTLKPNLVDYHPNNTSGVNAKIGYAADDLFDHSNHPIFAGLRTLQYSGHDYFPLLSGDGERHDCVWALKNDPIKIKDSETDSYMTVDFETVTNSIVLGTWEHVGDYNVMGLVEFLPAGDFKGRVIVNGLGGYEWKQNGGTNTYKSNIELLTQNSLTYLDTQKLKKVAYLLPVNLADGFSYDDALNCVDQDDERTGLQWFIDEIVGGDKGVLLRPKDLADLDPTSITTMWIHIDRDGLLNAKLSSPQNAVWGDLTTKANYRMIRRYVTNGGNLLLTKHAVQLVQDGGYIDRTSFAPTVEAGGAGDTPDSEGIKDNGHSWAINAVIGGAWAPTVNNYVSYTEPSSGDYATRTPTVDDGFDHRDSYLYNGLEVNDTEYPISNNPTTKYEVSYIVGSGVKEDHNTIWIFENGHYDSKDVRAFQNEANATVLGQWGHKSALDNAVIVDFKPTGAWNENAFEGHILCIGLGAYEWQLSNNTGAADHTKTNPYLDNIKQVTYNALNILENPDNPGFPVDFSYGGVSYHGETAGLLNYATIKSADASLEIYDLTKVNGDITEPGKILYNGRLYEITGINPGVFTGCTNMAYADLSAFQGVEPAEIRNYFPAQTLIYLPQGSNQTGTNIVNYDGSAWTSDKLLVYDRTFFANKYEFTASEVAYSRTYPEADGSYKTTIAMPFAISASEAEQFGKFYTFSNIISGTEVARFTPVSNNGTEAYQPYMFVPKSPETSISINATKTIPVLDANPAWRDGVYTLTRPLSVIQPGTGATFFAEYRTRYLGGSDATTAVDGGAIAAGYYAFRQGTYQTTSGVITALPFRAFLQTDAATGARQYAVMLDDGEATGINTIENNTQDNGAYYTLTGIRVAKPTMGVYIKNNRKVIIKK
ncbi:MAG: DUF4960 domain-containing protein [Prevotella sp.]|nr:DUF4960 domain-containing protein [Prevotella sp.]